MAVGSAGVMEADRAVGATFLGAGAAAASWGAGVEATGTVRNGVASGACAGRRPAQRFQKAGEAGPLLGPRRWAYIIGRPLSTRVPSGRSLSLRTTVGWSGLRGACVDACCCWVSPAACAFPRSFVDALFKRIALSRLSCRRCHRCRRRRGRRLDLLSVWRQPVVDGLFAIWELLAAWISGKLL